MAGFNWCLELDDSINLYMGNGSFTKHPPLNWLFGAPDLTEQKSCWLSEA